MFLERLVQWAERNVLPKLEEKEVVKLDRDISGAEVRYERGEYGRVVKLSSSGVGLFVQMFRTGEELYLRRSSVRKLPGAKEG